MEANDFESLGHALKTTFTIPMKGGGPITATVFATAPVAIVGIGALTVLGVSAMWTQEHRRPQDRPALAEGDGDGERLDS